LDGTWAINYRPTFCENAEKVQERPGNWEVVKPDDPYDDMRKDEPQPLLDNEKI
jgi:hypothetical protein